VDTRPFLTENTTNRFKAIFPNKYQDMLKFLCDSESTNVAFVFTIHSCQRKVALWAHRTLLDKYPRFQELFNASPQKADQNNSSSNRPVLVAIDGISLATFCILLKYIYTEDLDLKVEPSHFLLCDMDQENTSRGPVSSIAGLNKILEEHNAAQFYATWNIKDKVAWSDLFLAADRFEITELRKRCLENLLASVDDGNAIEILFGVGMRFKDELYLGEFERCLRHSDQGSV